MLLEKLLFVKSREGYSSRSEKKLRKKKLMLKQEKIFYFRSNWKWKLRLNVKKH